MTLHTKKLAAQGLELAAPYSRAGCVCVCVCVCVLEAKQKGDP